MKRQQRNPEKFDTLELFSSLSRNEGFRIDSPSDIEAFNRIIGASLKATLNDPKTLHGKRVEAMFSYVVGAMGRCKLIKQEDGGAVFSTSDDFVIPDYRIITNSDELFLIEVKNFHMKRFASRYRLKRSYLNKLQAYANKNLAGLKIAIYFSTINQWTLLSPDSFLEENGELWIDFPHAVARSEMSILGDRAIATLLLLRFEILCEQEGEILDDGTAAITIKDLNMYCNEQRLENSLEAQIAFYLMRYGKWDIAQDPAVVVDGRITVISFSSSPHEVTTDQKFEIIGSLSSMVSNAFRELTVDDSSEIISLDVKYDPEFFKLKIPENYIGKGLPIWQFIVQPNLEFSN